MKTSQIIALIHGERKQGTYKLALMRALIESSIQQGFLFKETPSGTMTAPLGILIDRWIGYYWPLARRGVSSLVTGGSSKMMMRLEKLSQKAFENGLKTYPVFRSKLISGEISWSGEFAKLCSDVRTTLRNEPMKHLGSKAGFYAIVKLTNDAGRSPERIESTEDLFGGYGSFEVKADYFRVFQESGHGLLGVNTLLSEWIEMTQEINRDSNLSDSEWGKIFSESDDRYLARGNLNHLLGPRVLQNSQTQICVWTGRSVEKPDWDHLFPWSVCRNSDLWNLLPSSPDVNRNEKRSSIPSVKTLEKSRRHILQIWGIIQRARPDRFSQDLKYSLGVPPDSIPETQLEKGFEAVLNQSKRLIQDSGFQAWDP